MSQRLCIATRNAHKLREITAVLGDLDLEIVGGYLVGERGGAADRPGCPDVREDGDTLEANAAKKARVVCAYTGLPTLADDSGLEVDALDGAPGVRSARWAGDGCTYADNNAKLLRELGDLPEARRTARFRCVMALALPDADVQMYEGRIEGRILRDKRGTSGFGYDPVFYVPELGRTLAELPLEQKNAISHRGRALAAVRAALERLQSA
ncbi:MAG: XTP/dITP diphosphatase [Candidatus Krumholzibacteriia bacterium]